MADVDKSPQDLFVRALAINLQVASVLVAEGFTTLEEVGYVPIDELRSIEAFDEKQVQDLRARARNYLLHQAIDGEDDPGPLSTVLTSPRPKPMSGGEAAELDGDNSSHGYGKA